MWTYDFWYYSIPANGSEHNRNYEQTQNYPCISLLPREPYCFESLHFSPSCTRLPLPPSTVRNMVWNNCVGRKIFNGFLCTLVCQHWYYLQGRYHGTNFGKLFRIFHFYHGMAYHRISRFQNLLSNYCLLYTSDTGCKEWWLPRREMLSFLSPPPKVEKIFLSQNAYWKVFFQRRNCWMAWRT